ncbi:unnamed protein product [Schistocephalus solidus]|uniref:XK-related protein n=1 Tax=Schistocephalus solidus TaxID=70667 RepID=A0A183T4F9_SCHSO|nr:unnamed protein product [Schistocephalus solidus]
MLIGSSSELVPLQTPRLWSGDTLTLSPPDHFDGTSIDASTGAVREAISRSSDSPTAAWTAVDETSAAVPPSGGVDFSSEPEPILQEFLRVHGFRWYHLFLFAVSVLSYLADVISDAYLTITYFKQARQTFVTYIYLDAAEILRERIEDTAGTSIISTIACRECQKVIPSTNTRVQRSTDKNSDTVFDSRTSGDFYWSFLTLSLMILPALVMTGFSLAWYLLDKRASVDPPRSTKAWIIRLVLHALQLAPIVRLVILIALIFTLSLSKLPAMGCGPSITITLLRETSVLFSKVSELLRVLSMVGNVRPSFNPSGPYNHP